MNGQRCEELFIQVSGNLIILLRAMVRLASISVTIPRSSRNVARRKNNKTNYPHLAYLPVETLRFASLGSSYIEPCSLQRDWRRGRPDATVASGRLNLALFLFFSPRDSALADACRIGLRFDVLSAKLEQEHTGGVHCMQVAFNVPAHAAMLVHELQIVKQLAEVCTSASDVTGEVRLETTRAFRRRRPSLRDLKLVPALVAVCCGSVGASFCPRQPTVALRALCATGGSITLDRST